jgi:hypothetical protein
VYWFVTPITNIIIYNEVTLYFSSINLFTTSLIAGPNNEFVVRHTIFILSSQGNMAVAGVNKFM